MTEATEVLPATRAGETRLIAGVCLAHMVSHYYIVLLAPLFVFIRADYGVSYTEMGLALTVFHMVSAVMQTPMGFLVDRTNPRNNLIGGLLLGAGAVAIAGLVDSFWVFIAMFGALGVANSVFHPADYALLSENVAAERISKAFSYHTCAGMTGSAIAPVTLLFMQDLAGWRGAFLGASLFGVVAALVLMLQREPASERRAQPAKTQSAAAGDPPDGWRLLLSLPILMNLAFFLVFSLVNGGLNQYLVVGLVALHHSPLALANMALTTLLAMSAVGVLAGGIVAAHTLRHGLVAACGLLATGAISVFIGLWNPGALLLIAASGLCGFATGIMLPSRDMIVRSVTPRGSFGKVFGFVSTGIHVGGMVAPMIFGQFLDHGEPQLVFLFVAVCAVAAVATVVFGTARRRAA